MMWKQVGRAAPGPSEEPAWKAGGGVAGALAAFSVYNLGLCSGLGELSSPAEAP